MSAHTPRRHLAHVVNAAFCCVVFYRFSVQSGQVIHLRRVHQAPPFFFFFNVISAQLFLFCSYVFTVKLQGERKAAQKTAVGQRCL